MVVLEGLRKSDIETAKAFISRQDDRFRSPFDRREQTWPRQCVFIGTSNHNDYLMDPTGGRRFLPLATGDIELLKQKRDQV